jgi:tetratricopeptide (TPR) repeat protein
VGTLLPVAGLIQVGWQAYADRYAYVPLIGVFIAIAWSLARATVPLPAVWKRATAGMCVAAVLALALVTRSQLPYWHDTIALFEHAIDVVPDNALAQNNLGMALVAQNRMPEAVGHFEKAAAIAPWDGEARANLGNALRALGRPADAVAAYEKALEASPEDATTYFNLATALVDLGRQDEAIAQLQEAVRFDPGYVKARLLLATILYRRGQGEAALTQLREVARIDPGDVKVGEWVRRLESQLKR